jgi:mannose-6-phosphate isomerase-like protein (cupin superfamily)
MARKSSLQKGSPKKSHRGSAELGLARPEPAYNISDRGADSASASSEKTGSNVDAPMQPGSVNRETAEHYRWGVDCDGWHLVKDKQLSVIEEFMPPGSAEVRHHHERSQQFFYILTGEVMMEINGENVLIPAGSGVRILPGTRHQIRNPSSSPVRFLVISQPPSHGDRIDE